MQAGTIASLAWVLLSLTGAAVGQGPIFGFGDNTFGQINVPSGNFIAIAASYASSAGIRADGTLAAWGDNSAGETSVPSGTFRAIDGGQDHYLAIRTDGTAVGWGFNDSGQASPPPGQFIQVAAGQHHSLGLRPDRTIAYWGASFGGTVPSGQFLDIAAGLDFSAAVRTDGTLVAWGNNSAGQLNVPSGSYTNVECAADFGAALRADGQVVFWGLAAPPTVGTLVDITTISAGFGFVLGLHPDGTLAATANALSILPPGSYSAIAGGGAHGLAIIPSPAGFALMLASALCSSRPLRNAALSVRV